MRRSTDMRQLTMLKVRPQNMKHIATVALMLNLGVAGVYADQRPVTMTFSGTSAPSTINLQYPSTNNSEDNTAGNGTLGPFTFRNVRAIISMRFRSRPALARVQLRCFFRVWPVRACLASRTRTEVN